MNTEKLKEISTSDYGSTYQGLADEYSIVDYLINQEYLVLKSKGGV